MSKATTITSEYSDKRNAGQYSNTVDMATNKAIWRLMPVLLAMYVVCFLDRANISFAQQALEIHAGISASAYALGAGLFFIGYAVFEVPSNLIMHRVGARWWMARIMVSWGIVATLFMFTTGPIMFYTLRFLLGVAEAGFFPGVILYLTYWFPQRKLGRVTALFYLGAPIALIMGSPLSGSLLELDGFWGLHGYQWMFLVEGLMAVFLGIFVFFYLTDRPVDASWLTSEETSELQKTLDIEAKYKKGDSKLPWWKVLIDRRILYFTLIYITIQASVYGLVFFLPRQVAKITTGEVGFLVGFLLAIPWIAALVFTFFIGRLADRTGRYRGIGAIMLFISCIGISWSAFTDQPILALCALSLAAIGFIAVQPCFWNLPTSYLGGGAIAAATGFINGAGNLGGLLAPNMRVWVANLFNSYDAGLITLAIVPFIGALLILGTRAFELKDRKLSGVSYNEAGKTNR